jgi:hypothetical protein
MALLLRQSGPWHAILACCESSSLRPRRRRPRRPTGVAAAPKEDSSASGTGDAVPGFLQNPAMARRELLRQFYGASSWQQQMDLLQGAEAQPLGLETRCASLLRGTGSSHVPPQAGTRWGCCALAAATGQAAGSCPPARQAPPAHPSRQAQPPPRAGVGQPLPRCHPLLALPWPAAARFTADHP